LAVLSGALGLEQVLLVSSDEIAEVGVLQRDALPDLIGRLPSEGSCCGLYPPYGDEGFSRDIDSHR
jgi:hypothetical protein